MSETPKPDRSPIGRLTALVEHRRFSHFISAVIAVNAVTLGLETSPFWMERAGGLLLAIDRVALSIFTIEIALKLLVYRGRFFRDPWNVFDFVIVAIALVPASGPFSVLRALRILRALRLLSVVPQMRFVVGALLSSIPGMGSIAAVLALVFYIAAVMATKLFGASHPHWFGGVGESMYTLFQVMTLESWSMGIVRPVMEAHPWAWAFFVPFIIVTSFAVLNLFIALIVNSLQTLHEKEAEDRKASEDADLAGEIKALRAELAAVRAALPTDRPPTP